METELLTTAPATTAATQPCPVCGSAAGEVFFETHGVPTQSGILWPTVEAARHAPTTDIRLAFCPHCHYIHNEAYEASKITHTRNDFSLEFSPSFRAFTLGLATDLIERYNLRNGRIVDIGCGDGDFLRTLCRLGPNTGLGIDPGYASPFGLPEGTNEALGVTFVKDYFGPATAHVLEGATFISCRHMLNVLAGHVTQFVRDLRAAIPAGTAPIVYVEVPNALYDIGQQVVWNIVNEHASWFTPASLSYLFRSAGFEVLDVQPCWHGEYLGLTARPTTVPDPATLAPTDDPETPAAVRAFGRSARAVMEQWQDRVDELRSSGKRVLAWGAGSRAITFLNTFDLADTVLAVVDIYPRRQGQFMPLTAHPVIAPEAIMDYRPDVIFITNPTYADEIRTQARQLGFEGEFLVL
ncbi:class I SAM-dependent methyltransferase [Hymenobacter jeollabukensis]|uniref:Methyltransferase domain-containing protein n=1 Tax=Hymenobacter jeollabukensis TaxID=2025313 RepID=A0A5R8WX82_9BACT|nr:class I SAM-dependent methyltransferase [Hymenobacter jeollabukensis]TLM97118.1 methyltransferase domain-containing protein [Hymenobacter jeollabukensis]